MRYALTDAEWQLISPILPRKSRGVPRVDDRHVLNGILWVLRSGAPWRDPVCFSPHLYRHRNHVERFSNRIKQCRCIATRHEKRAVNSLAFVKLAAIRLWLRVYESAT